MTDLLLVGAGHAHLYLVRHGAALAAAGYRVRLLAPRFFHYSGVAAATSVGTMPADAGRIDVRGLARGAGVEHCEGTLASLDVQGRVAVTADGVRLRYDVLSLNIGSVVGLPAGTSVDPDVLRVKPLAGLADLAPRLADAAAGRPGGATVTVVGGGATGLELAAHLAVRDDVATVRLLEGGPRVGAGLPQRARRRLERLLADRGVDVRTDCPVSRIGPAQTLCRNGSELSHDVAVLATGLVAPALVSELGLGDERGVPVLATLQHMDRAEIYAAGDCALFLPRPLPRVGVHGVRQGPVLYRSLLARRSGDPLPVYRPQHLVLSVLDLGDGTALAVRGRWWWYGTWALRLKRFVDRGWLQTYGGGGGR